VRRLLPCFSPGPGAVAGHSARRTRTRRGLRDLQDRAGAASARCLPASRRASTRSSKEKSGSTSSELLLGNAGGRLGRRRAPVVVDSAGPVPEQEPSALAAGFRSDASANWTSASTEAGSCSSSARCGSAATAGLAARVGERAGHAPGGRRSGLVGSVEVVAMCPRSPGPFLRLPRRVDRR
jgi:hypothetical protein